MKTPKLENVVDTNANGQRSASKQERQSKKQDGASTTHGNATNPDHDGASRPPNAICKKNGPSKEEFRLQIEDDFSHLEEI